ncbi:hypothetical protein [Erwinia sp. 198]|uniref:hypothetical protein n=1 Tax=Erwinia sp. 198 TaxID=2022746 RepID=UPI000F65D515|nr:hypothetical protein [Erwinia sp. 198]RRZ88974.1 hypothetical protein EGK14_16955 [Erwinia sp. 198]
MSKRSEIIEGNVAETAFYGLIYTEVLRWIDLGHAQGKDIRNLFRAIEAGEASGQAYYDVTYSQSMRSYIFNTKTGKFITWRIKHGHSHHERQSIALGMMVSLVQKFEGLQASFPLNMVTDSGFSGEDLVSDLLGFYRVISDHNVFTCLKPVSKKEALKRWDHYGKIGAWKNRGFTPILFPDPDKYPHARPHEGVLPAFMLTVRPWSDFQSGKVKIATADGSYLDKAKGGTLPYA